MVSPNGHFADGKTEVGDMIYKPIKGKIYSDRIKKIYMIFCSDSGRDRAI